MTRPAAILDIDGTLVDSNYQHANAWYRAFRLHGITIPVWRCHRAIGMGGEQLVPYLAARASTARTATRCGSRSAWTTRRSGSAGGMVLTLARSAPQLKVPHPGEVPTPVVPEPSIVPDPEPAPSPGPPGDPQPPSVPEPDPDRDVPIDPPEAPQTV